MGIYKATPGAYVLGMNIHSTMEALQLYKDVGYKLLAEEGINGIKVGYQPTAKERQLSEIYQNISHSSLESPNALIYNI